MKRSHQGTAFSALVIAKMLAASLLMTAALALPEPAGAAAIKLSKPRTAVRRPAPTSANSARNSATRASRNGSGRTSLRIGGSNGATMPASWRQSPPTMPADLRRGIATGVVLKAIPVKLPNAQSGELKLSRRLKQQRQDQRVETNSGTNAAGQPPG